MFCSKCGAKIADDSVFCNACGAKVNEVIGTHNSQVTENANISKKFENLSITNKFQERVNSEIFDDRHSQNMLFSLYAKLVNPVKEIENVTERIAALEERIQELRTPVDCFSLTFSFMPIVFIILFVIQFFPSLPFGTFYDQVIGPYIFAPASEFLQNVLGMWLCIIPAIILWLLTLLIIPFICCILTFVVLYLFVMLYAKVKNKIGVETISPNGLMIATMLLPLETSIPTAFINLSLLKI